MSQQPGMLRGRIRPGKGRLGDIHRTKKRDETFVKPGIKWLMFSFNLLFCIISLGLAGIGVWSYVAGLDYRKSAGDDIAASFDLLFNVSVLFMMFGGLVFMVSLFGLLGSLRENICILKTYFSLLLILFLMEIFLAIAVFALSDFIENKLESYLQEEAVAGYRDDLDQVNVVDWFQETFECCGVGDGGWREWELNKYFNCSSPGFEACSVPYSCCRDPYTFDAETVNTRCGSGMLSPTITEAEASETIYTLGCVAAVRLAIQDNMFLLGGIGIAIIIPQLVGLFLARILWGQVESQITRQTE
ncbi:tetraspanin-33-like isoform X1 [Watersipora subatra]|uniref:tetraspanin-33-like isoform X1 n=1 Tax=Watersipora subatra TaxID=2589382 RepID=UPI00355B77FF